MSRIRNIYLCEGETEQKFINTLKSNDLLIKGKIDIFNFAQRDISKIVRKYNYRSDYLIIIVDTDIFSEATICENIKILNKNKFKFCIFFQNQNLEDELKICCNKSSLINLYKDFYNVSSSNEFKQRFIKDNSLRDKLNSNSFNIIKLWSNGFELICVLSNNRCRREKIIIGELYE